MTQRFDWMSLGPRAKGANTVHVVVETPRGCRSKYTFDEALGCIRLHKMLPIGAAFPFDFGFVPGTRAEDGDPVDALVLGEEPTFAGCLVTVRLLGVIEATQTDQGKTIRNDRLIGVPETEKIRPRERSLADLEPGVLDQIEHFFVSYNQSEGREFAPTARRGPKIAARLVDEGVRAYESARKKARSR